MSGDVALAFEGVTFGYRATTPVLRDLDLGVTAGSATVVLGPNGTGKSTLLHLALGRLRPQAGRILIDGRPLAGLARRDLGRTVALVPQSERTPFDYSVLDLVLMARAPHLPPFGLPGARDRRIAAEAIEAVGLGHLRDHCVTQVSGGERQLALVARALAQQPRLLLLDEPTTHLDLAHKVRLIALLRDLMAAGITVLATTHEPDVAAAVATHVVLVRDGAVQQAGPRSEVFTAAALSATYGVPVEILSVGGREVVVWADPPVGTPGATDHPELARRGPF